LSPGSHPPIAAVLRSPGQARRAPARRSRLLPVVAHLGAGLGARAGRARRRAHRVAPRARAGLAARARAAPVPRLHGPAGPLLRQVAAARAADPVPARGAVRARRGRRAGAPCAPIVAEPVSPDEWAREVRPGSSSAGNRYRWDKYPSLESRISAGGALDPSALKLETIENYERTLSPALIPFYESHGYCWVVSGS